LALSLPDYALTFLLVTPAVLRRDAGGRAINACIVTGLCVDELDGGITAGPAGFPIK
jgi:hypothetical protein